MTPSRETAGSFGPLVAAAKRLVGGLDPRGRLSRDAYQHVALRLLIGAACIVCATVPLAAIGARRSALLLAGSLPILAAVALAQTIRRFHDRGRTGWWLAPNLAISLASLAPIDAWADRYPVPMLAYASATSALTLWTLIETLGRPGTPGANRYGAEPRADAP